MKSMVKVWQKMAKVAGEPTAELQRHLDGYAAFMMLAISIIAIHVERNARVSTAQVVDELQRTPAFWGLLRPLPVYRVSMLLSTAYRLGAFDGTGLELRRGIGFTRATAPKLRVIKGGRRG